MSSHSPVVDFLLSRRSRPAKMLAPPVPDRSGIEALLTIAARVPDHGKLEPWRFIVLDREACMSIADLVARRGAETGLEPEKCAKARATFAEAHLIIVVVASPKPSEKIPEIEQTLSAGAVCLSLVNGALASGWGANWLTGWAAFDQQIMAALGLAPQEWVAGFVHLGTARATPPDRPRPDIATLTTWSLP